MKRPNDNWIPREVIRLEIPEKHYLSRLLKELVRNRLEPSHGFRPISLPDTTWCHFDDSDFDIVLHIIAEIDEPCGWVKSRARRYDEGYKPDYLRVAAERRERQKQNTLSKQGTTTPPRRKPKQ